MVQRPKPRRVGKAATRKPQSSREKVRAHRERLRKRGFRLVQLWVPNTRSKEFIEQAHRASLAIARSAADVEDQAFLDSVSWWNSEEARALEAMEPDTPWWREPNNK